MLLDACSTRLCSFGWEPMSRLGWKPAPEFLASLSSGENRVVAEDALPPTLSPPNKRAKASLTDGSFSGRPATPRGIDLTAVGSYFRFFFGAAGSNGLCSFGWKPVSTLGWKPAGFLLLSGGGLSLIHI